MSSVSNGQYFLTLPLVSVTRVIYRKIRHARYLYIKGNVEKVWGARYTLGARYLSKKPVIWFKNYRLLKMELQCSGVATTLRAEEFRVRIALAVRVVSSERSEQLWGPRTIPVNGKRSYISGVERPGRVKLPNHPPPPSAEIKMSTAITVPPLYGCLL